MSIRYQCLVLVIVEAIFLLALFAHIKTGVKIYIQVLYKFYSSVNDILQADLKINKIYKTNIISPIVINDKYIVSCIYSKIINIFHAPIVSAR